MAPCARSASEFVPGRYARCTGHTAAGCLVKEYDILVMSYVVCRTTYNVHCMPSHTYTGRSNSITGAQNCLIRSSKHQCHLVVQLFQQFKTFQQFSRLVVQSFSSLVVQQFSRFSLYSFSRLVIQPFRSLFVQSISRLVILIVQSFRRLFVQPFQSLFVESISRLAVLVYMRLVVQSFQAFSRLVVLIVQMYRRLSIYAFSRFSGIGVQLFRR